MEFVELTEKEYRKFWENHPLKTFLSAPEISKLREKSHWQTYFVGVKENKKVLAATMLFSHARHFSKNEFYSPRGFLIDFKNKELLNFFVTNSRKFLKEHHAYVLRIDPYVIYKERDIDGNIVEDGVDNTEVINNLKSLGFKKVPDKNLEQVGWMFSLDLENKTEEEILKEMKQNTRNIIRKTEKFGIDIKELSYDELDRFHQILEETGARKHFNVRDVSYYQEMYKLFHDKGEVKYFVTELNLKKYLKKLEDEISEKNEKIAKLSSSKCNDKLRKNLEEDIANLNKRKEEGENIHKEAGKDIITLSGSMFILIKPEIIYLSSGNYEEYLKFNSQYLIQWELIKYGIANGFKKHNFYGIPANINTHPKDYGIYQFKRGFNGYVEELIGEYELPVDPTYYLFKLIHKIKGVKKK